MIPERKYNLRETKNMLRKLRHTVEGKPEEVYRFAKLLADELPYESFASEFGHTAIRLAYLLRSGKGWTKRSEIRREDRLSDMRKYRAVMASLADIALYSCTGRVLSESLEYLTPLVQEAQAGLRSTGSKRRLERD